MFDELADERLKEITELDEKVSRNDLVYKGKNRDENFDEYDNALDLVDIIRNGEIRPSNVKNDQIKFKSYLGGTKKDGKKSKEQKNAIYNIEMLYKARKETTNFFDD